AAHGDGPSEGLAMARMISQITFRSEDLFTDRFGREVVEPIEGFEMWQRFQVEGYLEYHGDKLARRFDANSYLLLTKAMDLHDVGRGRGGAEKALARLQAPVLAIGVASDILYPLYQSHEIVAGARAHGVEARSVELGSPHGHDAFLIEHEQLGIPLSAFLDDVETRHV
ncbi:MAG: homoserine O-acetyltransferase, partial [Acidimicrobiales bacterium]